LLPERHCSLKILLVEDNATIASQTCNFLEGLGWVVDYAESGSHGLALAQESIFDVLILDLGLPDRDGLPFLLENRLGERGAIVSSGPRYLENIAIERGLVTGQNPWSVYATAEAMVLQLGYTPVYRETTGDESSVAVLLNYHQQGRSAARETIDRLDGEKSALNRNLLIIHSLVAGMQWQPKQVLELLLLAQYMKSTVDGS
jgi:CheY-like chemotaxis protein